MSRRSATEIFEFLEQVGLLWQEQPELRFGQLIAGVMKDPTEIFVIKDKDLLKKLLKEYDNE